MDLTYWTGGWIREAYPHDPKDRTIQVSLQKGPLQQNWFKDHLCDSLLKNTING